MNEVMKIEGDGELMDAIRTLAQPRSDYVLEKFIVGKHETPEMRYAHCVLEIRMKYNALRRAKISLEKITYEIEELRKKASDGDKIAEFDYREREIGKEESEGVVIGAIRELQALYRIYRTFEKKYTREEINDAQEEYWEKRLTGQANNDMMASGRIGVGNLEALNDIGKGVVPQLSHVRQIEKNFIEEGNVSVMIAVATKDKAEDGLPCLEGIDIPETMQRKLYNSYGRSTAEAYNDIAREFLEDGADLLLVVEDDTFPPADAFTKLYEHIKQGKKAIGAWYLKRQEKREGAPIVIKEGNREYLDSDGEVHEVKTLPMGCTLYTAECFYKTTFPYFVTTETMTQDSFFSEKLKEAGIQMYCDTSIRCKHIDRETKKVYE